jgi:RNA polymerase sigma factor (sigma-70 family)
VAPGVHLYIQFGSQKIKQYARQRGYIEIFERAGAELIDPSCGACINAGPGASPSPKPSRQRAESKLPRPQRPRQTLPRLTLRRRRLRDRREDRRLDLALWHCPKRRARVAASTRTRQQSRRSWDKSVMDLSDNKPVPVDGLLSKELNDLIRRSLAALDEDKRLVFTLKVLHQCSYEEIAAITGFRWQS